MGRPAELPALAAAAALLCGCDQAPAPAPSPVAAQQTLSEAERRAIFQRAEAAREKNAQVTRRPRRFHDDSL